MNAFVDRDRALESVVEASAAWIAAALEQIRQIPAGSRGTGERLRLRIANAGIGEPRHHNVWGALVNSAIRAGLLAKTGEMANMQEKKSHARLTPVYIRTNYRVAA